MTRPLAVAVLAASLAAGATLLPAGAAAQAATSIDAPGVDTAGLTARQQEALARLLQEEFCYCGCPHTLGGCLREHRTCKHAPRMASLAVRFLRADKPPDQVRKLLAAYYAGFERSKRARLDVKEFGPPLGRADAPAVLVEFSDYTCPFCQRVKPELDRFVRENGDRVRLYYKPFPIPSHARALEAALAGEWARLQGLFWKMYDQLFDHPHALSDDDLAGDRAVGGDADDLRRALETGQGKPRVTASMAEARAAGITGTPTLYLDGRKLDLSLGNDLPELLGFTLEDEEEWTKHGGWARD